MTEAHAYQLLCQSLFALLRPASIQNNVFPLGVIV